MKLIYSKLFTYDPLKRYSPALAGELDALITVRFWASQNDS